MDTDHGVCVPMYVHKCVGGGIKIKTITPFAHQITMKSDENWFSFDLGL